MSSYPFVAIKVILVFVRITTSPQIFFFLLLLLKSKMTNENHPFTEKTVGYPQDRKVKLHKTAITVATATTTTLAFTERMKMNSPCFFCHHYHCKNKRKSQAPITHTNTIPPSPPPSPVPAARPTPAPPSPAGFTEKTTKFTQAIPMPIGFVLAQATKHVSEDIF